MSEWAWLGLVLLVAALVILALVVGAQRAERRDPVAEDETPVEPGWLPGGRMTYGPGDDR